MTLLITGGGGFVMSNLAHRWLATHPEDHVVILDNGPLDDALLRFLSPYSDNYTYVRASVLDTAALDKIADDHTITHIVHGATVCLSAPQGPDGHSLANPETEVPATVLEVNIMGAVRVLEMARRMPSLKAFINISSGAVYNDYGPEPAGPMPEEGWVDPPEFYGISKVAAEQITRRYRELFGINAASVRLSGVYGPMDRWRPSRAYQCPPKLAIHHGLAGKPVRINAPEGVGDHLHAADIAVAIASLLEKNGTLDHTVYNVAYGEAVTLEELFAMVKEIIPGLIWEIAAPKDCDFAMDARFKGGRWGAYDISRITNETGWTPRPLQEALRDYADFVKKFGTTA